jgi:hypothetical protein
VATVFERIVVMPFANPELRLPDCPVQPKAGKDVIGASAIMTNAILPQEGKNTSGSL